VTKGGGALFNLRNTFFQTGFIENTKLGTHVWNHQNLVPKKTNEARSSINKKLIPPKDISSKA
jgi:hypothetical protein